MKKVKERDVRILEGFCVVTAVLAAVLCSLYLFDVLQNHWFLNFILGLAVLLHVAQTVLYVIRKKRFQMVLALVFTVFYAVCLVYFNI